MALFRNLGVKLRGSLCGVLKYVSAQTLVFLDLAKNYAFMNWKPTMPAVALLGVFDLAVGNRKEIFEKWHRKFTKNYARQPVNAVECTLVWTSLSSMS